jgi:predicted TIM-barrel fold metal-dependent hydrolase
MRIIDTHFHLWDLAHPVLRYGWVAGGHEPRMLGSIDAIARTYRLQDYRAEVAQVGVDKAVHVQCADGPPDPVVETQWLQDIADKHGWPQAIVAYADLQRSDPMSDLERQAAVRNVRGIRNFHLGETFGWTDSTFRRNVGRLADFGLHYELRARADELESACGLVRAAADVQIVLTHAGLPIEQDGEPFERWREGIVAIGRCDNVVCKLSGFGMMSHISGQPLTGERLRRLVQVCLEAFGCDRLLFGANWPVDRLCCTYPVLLDTYCVALAGLSPAELDQIFWRNAERVYRL